MLKGPGSFDPHGKAAIRLCSICDGMDAVMLFAAYAAQIGATAQRTDLSPGEALEHLRLHADERFDQIVLVPNVSKAAAPRLMQALKEEASRHSPDVVLLLPQKSRLKIPAEMQAGLRILSGPPFIDNPPAPETSPEEGETAPAPRRASWLGRLVSRRKGEEPASPDAATPEAITPDLPAGLQTVMILPVCGGVGSSTIAVNLAVEAAAAARERTVCLIDLNLQYGNVATYAGLSANSRIVDAYRGIESLDADAFELCLQGITPNLHVFPGPGEILPADGISAHHLRRIITLARSKADLVIVDLPHQIADWTGAAFDEASVLFAVANMDVRSAQNLTKLQELLRSEDLAAGKFFCVVNRAPVRRPRLWETAREQFEKAHGFTVFRMLPEGGTAVSTACDAGVALRDHAPENPLRLALRDLASELTMLTTRKPAP